jgi:dolichol-phosphate mannosyltransferase
MTAPELQHAAGWDEVERLVVAGHDSARIAVGPDRDAALAAARAGIAAGHGPTPPRPWRSGRRVLIVLPTYDEASNLEAIVDAILRYVVADLLIVDDASPDGTGAIADRIAAARDCVRVLHRSGKQGLGTAYLAGFRDAIARGYERVFEMDADFSHPPWDLPRLLHAGEQAELVIGSRYVRGGSTAGWSMRRRLLSRGANWYARTLLGARVRDMTAGFRCYDVAALAKLDLDSVAAQGYAFQIEMVDRCRRAGMRIRELPIHFVDRRQGKSKMDARIAREALLLVPRLRARRGR